jgi:hypothetical protein
MRVHPDDHAHEHSPLAGNELTPGGHRYFELGKPLLSLSSHGALRERKPDESHANDTGGQPPKQSVSPGTWTESGQTPALPPSLK